MKICVINGSPRGQYSVTLQTMLFLQKLYPNHQYSFLHAGAQIRALERDFSLARKLLEQADLIVFCYPVYTFLAPSQLHRFIRLMKTSGIDLAGKFATQVTTSKHFYDVTAHQYIEDNCHDMGLKVIHGFSADMGDLLTIPGQWQAERFFHYALWCALHDLHEPAPAPVSPPAHYQPSLPWVEKEKVGLTLTGVPATVIVADLQPGDDNLKHMIADFQAVYPYPTRLVNLAEFSFQGGCLGCLQCAGSGACIYQDGFAELLKNITQSTSAILYAFTIQDHSMGTVFKTYDDRQFFNGHRPEMNHLTIGYLINGHLEQQPNLRMVLEARCQINQSFLAGIGTDPASIAAMAQRIQYAMANRYVPPQNFYGVGGMKIFRDLVWQMQGLMRQDHRFYTNYGLYDFPQNQRGTMLKSYLIGALMRNPKLSRKLGSKINQGMIAPYQKVIQQADSAILPL